MKTLDEVLQENQTLAASCATAQTRIGELTAQLSQANAGYTKSTELLTAANAQVSELQAKLKASEDANAALKSDVEKLTASQKDFDAKLSARIVELGIRKEGVGVAGKTESSGKDGDKSDEKLSLTEQCIRAKASTTK